jgi:hypothetical protein
MSGTVTLFYSDQTNKVFSDVDLSKFLLESEKQPSRILFSKLNTCVILDKQGCIWTFLTNNAKILLNLQYITFDKCINDNCHIKQFYEIIDEKDMIYEMSNHDHANFTVGKGGISYNPSQKQRPVLKKLLSSVYGLKAELISK